MDEIKMRYSLLWFCGLLAALTLSACGGDWGPEDDGDGFGDTGGNTRTDVDFEVIHQGSSNNSGDSHDRRVRFLTDQIAYEDELAKYSSTSARDIEFSDAQLLLVDMGTQPTGGYSVAVSDVYEESDVVNLIISYTHPESDCSVTQAETDPYLFIRLDSSLDVILTEEIAYTAC
jgi:hypothetical protein